MVEVKEFSQLRGGIYLISGDSEIEVMQEAHKVKNNIDFMRDPSIGVMQNKGEKFEIAVKYWGL